MIQVGFSFLVDESLMTAAEATRKVLTPDGWYKSGDLGYLDEEGFLHIKDRSESWERS
jgi:acyl-CoA synthetase (AMP-forming)/AMP-acid ligase II